MTSRAAGCVVACAAFVIAASRTGVVAQDVCPLAPVKLSDIGATLQRVTIVLSGGAVLGDPNGPKHAMVWEEPMRLRQPNGKDCTVDPNVSIITAPVFDAGGRVLYVTTYSGSQSFLFAINTSDCKVLWRSPTFTRGPYLKGRQFLFSGAGPVTVGADCLPTSADHR